MAQQEDLMDQNMFSPSTIEELKEMFTNTPQEIWTFREMDEEIYSAQIIIEDGYLLLKSLSKKKLPADVMKVKYQDVEKFIDRNNITTFLEINRTQIDASLEKIFIHIQLQGSGGIIRQFELLCSGEDNGISYANTTFLETHGNKIVGGIRNDGSKDVLQDTAVGRQIIKTIAPGIVAVNHEYREEEPLTTRFAIYTKKEPESEEKYCIGKVVYGLDEIENLYLQARIHEAKSIDIDNCGIVLARRDAMNMTSPITIEFLKYLVSQSTTSGVWTILKKKDQTYHAQIVFEKGYLYLKSLSNQTTPPEDAIIIHYRKVKGLVDRNAITVFLEIKFSEEEDSNFGNKFIHIKLSGDEGRHLQFEVMCTGEVDGISYAKTVFLNTDSGLCGGARSDGQKTELPGFERGETKDEPYDTNLVSSLWRDSPTNFGLCPEDPEYAYLGHVVYGIEDVQTAYRKAKEKGPDYVLIDDCGIVLD